MNAPEPVPPPSKWRDLAAIVTRGPIAAAAIPLEARFARWWPLRFPRSIDELERDPSRLLSLLTQPSPGLVEALPLPRGAVLSSVRRPALLANEPDKNRTTAVLELTFTTPAGDHVVPIVAKFQSGRGMPLYMQAIRAAVEPGFSREIAFYRQLAPVVPVRVAKPLFADAVPAINRVCLIVEHIESTTIADWRGCPLPAMQAMLDAAARLNARFLGRLDEAPTAWIPARGGLDFLSFVETFIARTAPWHRDTFAALQRYFAARPVTLAHGDCRPGNMLFTGPVPVVPDAALSEDDAAAWPATADQPGVVMSDWEAVNIAPLLWDFTYATTIGLRVGDRKAWVDRLLERHLQSLESAGVARSLLARESSRVDVDLLAMALAYLSLVIIDHKLWSNQGNTAQDGRAWVTRVLTAATAGNPDKVAATLGIAPATVTRLHEHWSARRTELLQ